ncbi:hypothetical protein FSP39_020617 [Pinctada imbricata]|uniref:PiggyBac transposable element-derived protein domain-containing protein n=1 Tax=Pinctada imbricata TaxID=66713 RepID=A0AA89BZU3_PINIB|nr:hypothetical protein FSP39_020617 [Pinctada imbricata]
MASDSEESDLSGDENFDDIGNFDLVNVNNDEQRRLERQFRAIVGDSSDSESDFEGFEPEDAYRAPTFDTWTKNENPRNLTDFSERTGPTRVLDGSNTALDFFKLFYTDELMKFIVEMTNLNARRKRESDPQNNKGAWSDVTLEELRAFYGLLFLMEVMSYDRDEMYWSNNAKHWLVGSKFGEIMTRDRFIQIRRYLHFSDDNEASNHRNDKLFKVRRILDSLRNSFQSEYAPHKDISVDEAMIPFKGRLGMKQYMKDKPVKFGIKMWVAADADTAYCHNFEVYVGKNTENIDKNLGMVSQVVISLTKHLEMKGQVIYTDNFYTSPTLADFLYSRQTYLCGTIRVNRKGYPKELVRTVAQARRMARGDSDWLMCGPLLASYWKDNRIVYYLSSYHQPSEANLTTTRRNKDGSETTLSITPTVKGYATNMGGVDRLDQMSRVNKSKKSMRWYRKIEMKLRDIALYNAYVIEGTVIDHTPTHKRKRDLLSFRLDLAHQLIGSYRQERRAFKRPRMQESDEMRLDEKSHWPQATGSTNTVCVVCNKKHNVYKGSHPGCSVAENPCKRTKTTLKCQKCDVPLCCNSRSTCFEDYHTKVYYWQ